MRPLATVRAVFIVLSTHPDFGGFPPLHFRRPSPPFLLSSPSPSIPRRRSTSPLRLGGLCECISSPSGSWADKRISAHFRHEFAPF